MRQITYNSQRNNYNFKNKFSGYKQCFSTCSWMFISYYDKRYSGNDDLGLALYFDDIETSVGKKGIGEKIKAKFSWITGKTSYWGVVQEAGIQKMLPSLKIIFDTEFPIDKLAEKVRQGPVIISTKKMGGLRGGHIILLVDVWGNDYVGDQAFVCHDPYGNALTNYGVTNGEYVHYGIDWLKQHINRGDNKCWVIYAG